MGRTAQDIVRVLWAQLREIAEREGPEGGLMIKDADITADFINQRQSILATVTYRSTEIWRRKINMSEHQLLTLDDKKFTETISGAMRGTLSLAGQLEQARLSKLFPNAIKNVLVTYDIQRAEKCFQVVFNNGHMAEGFESEIKTELFTARCTMLYDLPPL